MLIEKVSPNRCANIWNWTSSISSKQSTTASLIQRQITYLIKCNGESFVQISRTKTTTVHIIHELYLFIFRSKATNSWKWGGCSHNMNFGIEFSELFLDALEKAGDVQSKINLHNNRVGRMVKNSNVQDFNNV